MCTTTLYILDLKKKAGVFFPCMIVYAYAYLGTREAEAGGFFSSRLAKAVQWGSISKKKLKSSHFWWNGHAAWHGFKYIALDHMQ